MGYYLYFTDEIHFYMNRVNIVTRKIILKEPFFVSTLNLGTYFMQDAKDSLIDPEEILKFIDKGSILMYCYIHTNYVEIYKFLIVLNIDKQRKIIEFFESGDSFMSEFKENDIVKNLGGMKFSFYQNSHTRIVNYHNFVLKGMHVFQLTQETILAIDNFISNLELESTFLE